MKKILLLTLMSFSIESALGEYRVYQYYVRSKVQNINPPKAELVTSTLDPVTYAAYNGGKLSVEVNLLRTWVCMGNTSKKSICTISEGQELQELQKDQPTAGVL